MTEKQRILHVVAALTAMVSAVVILWLTGLPERAEFSGEVIPELGLVAPEVDALAPPFLTTDLTDEPIDLLGLRGELIILNFWATWCEPCIVEMPILQSIHEDFQDDTVQVIGVNMGESPAIIQHWITENDFTFRIIPDEQAAIVRQYRLRGQPSTFIISPQGIITHVFYGPVQESTLREIVEANSR